MPRRTRRKLYDKFRPDRRRGSASHGRSHSHRRRPAPVAPEPIVVRGGYRGDRPVVIGDPAAHAVSRTDALADTRAEIEEWWSRRVEILQQDTRVNAGITSGTTEGKPDGRSE